MKGFKMNPSMNDWPVVLNWQDGLTKSPFSNNFYRVTFDEIEDCWHCEHKLSIVNVHPVHRTYNSNLMPIIQHDWVMVPTDFSTEKSAQNWAHEIESKMLKSELKRQGKWVDPDGKPGY